MDLTKFDLNAHNFWNSENVEAMTDAEVGQYILLLVKSWLLAKDASLPDDLPLLAKWAHCKAVSAKVLARFPVIKTSDGRRRQNKVLYDEWLRAVARTSYASENGKAGAVARWGSQWGSHSHPNGVAINVPIAQTKPTIPNQSDQSNEAGSGNFKNFKTAYRRAFRKRLSSGDLQRREYAEACRQFGEDTVLARFEEWQAENQWVADYQTNGLKKFYEALPEMVEEDKEVAEARPHQEPVSDTTEDDARRAAMDAKLAEEQEASIRFTENADSLFGG